MNCDDVRTQNLTERYVTGDLGNVERDEFEEHVFTCPECLDELQVYQAIRTELSDTGSAPARSRSPRERWVVPVSLAALAALIAVVLWIALPNPDTEIEQLRQLAVFEPPASATRALRNAGGEARQLYRDAMQAYAVGDWAAARDGLVAASSLDPKAPDIAFFLGITELLTGNNSDAIGALRRAAASGESVYLEEARYYLAMAHLRAGHKDEATAELGRVVEMNGELAGPARTLLRKIEAL